MPLPTPGLGAILSNIGVPLANTVASSNFAQKAEEDRQRQIVMQQLALQRQDRLDTDKRQLEQAQSDYYNRGRLGDEVSYVNNGMGGLIQVPKHAGTTVSGPTSTVPPQTNIPVPRPGPVGPPVAGLNAPTIPQGVVPRSTPGPSGMNGPSGNIDLALGDASSPPPSSAPPSAPPATIGRNTGITMAVKPPPRAPVTPLSDKLQARVSALVAGGMSLAKASDQARLEFGQQNTPAPASFTFNPSGVDANGNPVFAKGNTRTGELVPTTIGAKTPAVSATNQAAAARLQAAVSEMNNADPSMSAFEAKLANKTANINGLQQFMGSVGSVFTKDDPEAIAKQTAALAVLNNTNPELARYIRRGLSFAEGESMVSQRPSDFRTRMAAFLSTAPTGASPEMIQDIQSRRRSILTPLNTVVMPNGGRGGGNPAQTPPPSSTPPAPIAASPLRQKYDAAVAHLQAQGQSQAQIDKVLGAPPP